MIPAKSRERKCSTCKHYQPSPLWRKGWCRNPLLYDRNTNHLVEADSLACNRTFIDYWEPVDGPGHSAAPTENGRAKPRIAPSVPLEHVDKKGNRKTVTGNTSAMGMSSTPPKQVITLTPTPKQSPFASMSNDDDLLEDDLPVQDARATLQMEQVEGPQEPPRQTTQQRIQKGRAEQRKGKGGVVPIWSRSLPFVGVPIWMALALIAVLAAAIGGFFALSPKGTIKPVGSPTPSVRSAQASPTGFGDPTFTVPPKPTDLPATTAPTVPSNVLAPGAFAVVKSASGLSVRDAPTTKGKKLTVLANGSRVHITGPSKVADGFTWWPIDQFDAANPQRAGWCVEQFLAPAGP